MASTDVSRWISRPPLSLHRLHLLWFSPDDKARCEKLQASQIYYGTEGGRWKTHDPVIKLDHNGGVCTKDVLPDSSSAECFQNGLCAQKLSSAPEEIIKDLISVQNGMPTKEAVREIGVGQNLTVTMAAAKPSRACPSPSDKGGDSVGAVTEKGAVDPFSDQSNLIKSSTSHFNMKNCLEKFCSISIEDSVDEMKHVGETWNSGTSSLMQILKEIGVTAHPTQYLPREFRMDSTEIFCKNLFLKDRRGQFYLVICDENTDLDLKILRRKVKANRNVSFATSFELMAILKSTPGAVTPFAVMHETARDVSVVMTTDVARDDVLLNFHPLEQNLTLPIKLQHLKTFFKRFRFDLKLVDMSE